MGGKKTVLQVTLCIMVGIIPHSFLYLFLNSRRFFRNAIIIRKVCRKFDNRGGLYYNAQKNSM